jgi:hypothetical protein
VLVLTDVILVDLLRFAHRDVVALVEGGISVEPERREPAGDLVVPHVVGDDVLESAVVVEQQDHRQEAVGVALVGIGQDLG